MFKRKLKANLSNLFPLGGTGYVKDIPPSERIPPKSLGSAVPDPHALANTLLMKAHSGVNAGEPAPSVLMDTTIDGHQYKGVLYLVSDEQE